MRVDWSELFKGLDELLGPYRLFGDLNTDIACSGCR
jgi:hypothetical protein